MAVMDLARQMGKEIQASDEYKNLYTAKDANDSDENLQMQIGKFNLKRTELNTAMSAEEKDDEKIAVLNDELKEVYAEVMQNTNMLAFNDAKNALDGMMNKITTVLMKCVNGEDPDTCEDEEQSCGGGCSTCGGCH